MLSLLVNVHRDMFQMSLWATAVQTHHWGAGEEPFSVLPQLAAETSS